MKEYIITNPDTCAISMFCWCQKTFGEISSLNNTWNYDWWSDDFPFVKYIFYDESMATQFILKYGDIVISSEKFLSLNTQ